MDEKNLGSPDPTLVASRPLSGLSGDAFVRDDGGRAAAGFKGSARDCVARSVAIASGRPYAEVYAALARGTGEQRASKNTGRRAASARNGVFTRRKWFKDYMASIGFKWTPTMQIGSGCTVHLNAAELPKGRLVVAVSKHYTAMIDGVIHDTFDPRERGTTIYPPHTKPEDLPRGAYRLTNPDGTPHPNGWAYKPECCVYGYWSTP